MCFIHLFIITEFLFPTLLMLLTRVHIYIPLTRENAVNLLLSKKRQENIYHLCLEKVCFQLTINIAQLLCRILWRLRLSWKIFMCLRKISGAVHH